MSPATTDRDEIVRFCDELLAVERFDDYGPNGLQVPGRRAVTKLATGVTANREFLAAAVDSGADLAIVHHGLFFGDGPRALSERDAGRLRVVLGAELSIAAYHLPLDAHPEIGNNALLCRLLGLEPDPAARFGFAKGSPIGVVGRSVPKIAIGELVERVRGLLGREPFVFDQGPEATETVGILSGGAARNLDEAA
ncbi:MAG: Nif3-like dinuclear metal center hexameric protein, partial [Solirubrobacterales bacterium]